MPQPIQLLRTTGTAPPPSPLLPGEPAVCISPTVTRFWLGDGTTNRLLFTSDPEDPLGPGIILGDYLPLTGGQMSGAIETLPPVNGPDAANKAYVDGMVTSVTAYLGTWQVASNTPSISGGGTAAGQFYIATTVDPAVGEVVPAGVPGIAGQTVFNGDWVIWNAGTDEWQIIPGGPLTQTVANALYVQLAGSTMTGPLILNADPVANLGAVTKQYVDNLLQDYLPLAGGNMTGGITMPSSYTPSAPGDVVTVSYVDDLIAGANLQVIVDGISIGGNGTTQSPLTVILVDGGTF